MFHVSCEICITQNPPSFSSQKTFFLKLKIKRFFEICVISVENFIRHNFTLNIKIYLKMNTRTPRDLNQIETKKRLEILVKDEKYWQEKVVLLAKQFSISDEEIKESNVSK